MKRTQIKDSERNIRKHFVSWVSVIVISFLAVTAFLGIRFSADALRLNADVFYEDAAFSDVTVYSTLLLTPEDIEAISEEEGIRCAEGFRQIDTNLKHGDSKATASVVSLGTDVNRPILKEGRFPGQGECLLEEDLANQMGYQVGDTLTVPEDSALERTSFVISGTAVHPDHIVGSINAPGPRYVMIDLSDFSDEEFDGCFTGADVLIDKASGTDYFSEDYLSLKDGCADRLEKLGRIRRSSEDAGRAESADPP